MCWVVAVHAREVFKNFIWHAANLGLVPGSDKGNSLTDRNKFRQPNCISFSPSLLSAQRNPTRNSTRTHPMWPRPKKSFPDPAAPLPGWLPWLEHAGPAGTVLLIAALEIAAWRRFNLPNPPALLVLTVVFSAFAGSFRAGFISAGLAWIYFCHALGEPGQVLVFTQGNLEQLIVWTFVLPLLVTMVGLLRRHALRQAARRLREIEERFRLLAGTLEDQALLSLDRDGRIRSWNFGASRIHGWGAEEIIGQPLARLYAPGDAELGLPTKELAKAAAGGRLELEGERARKDGSTFQAAVIFTSLQDDKGKLRGYLMRLRDLSRTTPAEAALMDRAHQQVAVAALGQSALVGIDPQTLMDHAAMFVMQTLKVEFCDILELQPDGKSLLLKAGAGWKEGVIGQTTVIASPGSMAAYTLASAEPVIVKDLGAITQFQVPPFLRDHGVHSCISLIIAGQEKTLGILEAHTTRARVFTEDDFHFLQGVANVLATAHARKRAEAENEHLAAFAQFNPNPMLEFAADGALTYVNDATRTMVTTLQKTDPLEILPADASAIIKHCLDHGANRLGLESTLSGRTISWSFFPIPAINRVHVYAVDITERLNLEAQFRQSQKMEAIGQLAAGVAHDFNNLLTIMQGHVARLLGRGPAPEQTEPLQQVLAATDRAASMTRQLLAFGRRQVMLPRALDLRETVANMTKMLERLIGEEVSLRVEKRDTLPPVFADPSMMEQILLNFVVNARDAMPPGGGEITVRTAAVEVDAAHVARQPGARPGTFVCLSVTDTGSGMDAATQARIFEPFFTTKEVGKGTGLGLATVFGIVQQHAGWIEVQSAPGQGSTFSVLLPATAQAVASAAPAEAAPVTPARGGHETILLVEDEPVLRDLAKAILSDAGYTILEAGEGVEALAQWRQHGDRIDLLLTDMVLPGGMSGRSLAEMISSEKPALKVIFTTGYSPDQLGEDSGIREGLNFLQKPYHPPALIKTVRACLDAK